MLKAHGIQSFLSELLWPRRFWLRALRGFGFFTCLLILIFNQWRVHHLEIAVGMEIPDGSDAELYYSYNGIAYYPEQSQYMVRRNVSDGNFLHTTLISSLPIRGLRIDPINGVGEFSWRSLTITGVGGVQDFTAEELKGLVKSSLDIEWGIISEGVQTLSSTGADPQLSIEVPAHIIEMPVVQHAIHVATLLGFSLFGAFLLDFVLRISHPSHPFSTKTRNTLDRISNVISEDGTIRFSRSSILVLMILFFLSLIWTGLKLHQSSLGMWDGNYPREYVHRLVDIGKPQPIRSDEWSVFSPWTLSQVQTGMKYDNPNLGAPASPILTGSPVAGPLMIAQPKYWGFLAFDIERGFSWMWAYKFLGLIGAFFLLLLVVTKGDTVISLAGAIGLYGSSYMQWWYSSSPPEVVIGFSMALVGSFYLLQARKIGGMLFGGLVLAIAIPNLILHLYPPSLLQLAYLAFFILIGLLANKRAFDKFCANLHLRAALLLAVLVVWFYLLSIWFFASKETIELMMNTHYPGRRVAEGGDMAWNRLFYGFFESWQITEDERPFPPANNSSISSFWLMFPLIAIMIPFKSWIDRGNRLLLAIAFFCLMAVLWAAGPLPGFFRSAMSLGGWYMVPGSSAIFGLGVASIVMASLVTSKVVRGELTLIKLPTIFLAVFVFIAVYLYGLGLQAADPVFFNLERVLLASFFVALLVSVIHRGMRFGYLLVCSVVAFPMLYVNPVQSGISAHLNKGIFVVAREASGSSGDLWAVFGEPALAQGFKMGQMMVLNGTHYAPRLSMIQAFDPDLQQGDVWNRYAHIEMKESSPGELPVFESVFVDHYRIVTDVCGPHIKAAGVTHLAFAKEPPSQHALSCLDPIPLKEQVGVFLYRLL